MRPDRWLMLWRMALRNVLAQRVKSLIVGSVFALGTALTLVGGAVVDAMDLGMQRSVVESLAGHLQLHSANGRDELAIYGDEFAGLPEIGVMPDFQRVAEVVRSVPNVAAVVPMGSQFAMVAGGNDFDRRLADLRAAVKAGDEEAMAAGRRHVRQMLEKLLADLDQARVLGKAERTEQDERLDKARAAGEPRFWADFDDDPLEALERFGELYEAGETFGVSRVTLDSVRVRPL